MPKKIGSGLFRRDQLVTNKELDKVWLKAKMSESPDRAPYRAQKENVAVVPSQVFIAIIGRVCEGDGIARILKLDVPKIHGKKKVYLEALAWCRNGSWKLFKTYVPFDQPLATHLSVVVRSGSGRVQ